MVLVLFVFLAYGSGWFASASSARSCFSGAARIVSFHGLAPALPKCFIKCDILAVDEPEWRSADLYSSYVPGQAMIVPRRGFLVFVIAHTPFMEYTNFSHRIVGQLRPARNMRVPAIPNAIFHVAVYEIDQALVHLQLLVAALGGWGGRLRFSFFFRFA